MRAIKRMMGVSVGQFMFCIVRYIPFDFISHILHHTIESIKHAIFIIVD